MSKEKLYAIKNEGEWADTNYTFGSCAWVTPDKNRREEDVRRHGGHVVTLIEEPKQVVLTKEQAEIVENARYEDYPASYISEHTGDEELLMNAYVNGYTVAKEKKYNVKVPHAVDSYFKKISDDYCIARDTFIVDIDEDLAQFTKADIEHYGLQDCEKEEVTDDEQ